MRTRENNSELIKNIQDTNKSIRQKALLIGLAILIVYGILKVYTDNQNQDKELRSSIIYLSELKDTSDRKAKIEKSAWIYRFPLRRQIDYSLFLYQLEKSNYKDTALIDSVLHSLKEQKEALKIDHDNVVLLGVRVPVKGLMLILPLVFLFMFHDLSQVIYFKKILLQKYIKKRGEEYLLGPEFLKFMDNTKDSTIRYYNLVSHVVLGSFFIFSFSICTALILLIVSEPDSVSNNLVSTVSVFFLVLILIEIILIFYHENILKFSFFIKIFLNEVSEPVLLVKIFRFVFLFLIPFFALELHFLEGMDTLNDKYYNNNIIDLVFYTIVLAFMLFLFPLSVWLTNKYSQKSPFIISLRLMGIITYILVTLVAISSLVRILTSDTHGGYISLKGITINNLIVILVCLVTSLVYVRFIRTKTINE